MIVKLDYLFPWTIFLPIYLSPVLLLFTLSLLPPLLPVALSTNGVANGSSRPAPLCWCTELTSGPSESIMEGGMAINPILAELKTIMEAL